MKLGRKLMMASVAALLGVSPVLGASVNNAATVNAATNTVYNTYGKNSKITATRTVNLVNSKGKKIKKTARKGGKYTIWNVTRINGVLYYSIQTTPKQWIPASATKGTVTYKDGKQTVELTTNGTTKFTRTVYTPVAKKSTAKKQAPKKTNTKSSKNSSSKTATKKTTAKSSAKNAIKATKIESISKKAQVYDQNGKAVKTYMGRKKYATMGKGVKVNGLGTKTINGEKYYALEPNHYYVKASDFKVVK